MDIAASMTIAKSSVAKQAAMYNIAKKQNDIESGILEMLMNTALSAPPPGQGTQIDVSA